MTENKPPLILVDGSSYLFRAFHAMPPLENSKGNPTGAIYGVINMMKKLIADYQPSHLAMIFDAKGKTFRNDLYSDYKSNRPPMPDDLRSQIQPLHDLIIAMGVPLVVVSGVEADDVIGTLAVQASKDNVTVLISTGDKDLAQLVTPNIELINTMSRVKLDVEGVMDKFAVRPDQIIDYLALMGDTSDNIPGVPKVGPKTAAKWLGLYDTLENLMVHADEIKGKVGESLRLHLDQLPLSKELTTIKLDVADLPIHHSLSFSEPNSEDLISLFSELEFKTWLGEAKAIDPSTGAQVEESVVVIETQYQTILDKAQFEIWLDKLQQSSLFAFDTETTSLDYMQAQLVGVSFSVKAGEAAYVPFAHDYIGAPEQLDKEYVLQKLKPLLENEDCAKVGQNLKYDASVLARQGINLKGIRFDTMLESYVINSVGNRHDMNTLALKFLNHQTIHFEDVAGKGKKQITFNQVDLELAGPYAAEDADITLRLHEKLWPLIDKEEMLKSVFENIELPLIKVLSSIERTGVIVDSTKLLNQSSELAIEIAQLQTSAYSLAGTEFNLASPKQLQEILFEKLGLPILKRTPKKQPSTAEEVLQELANDYELPSVILQFRSLSKLKSTYTDKLPKMVNPDTGRIHTSYHQAVTATGRLSSTEPNLQNIPIRTEQGRRIRKAFIPEQGYKMVAIDYSQIELRIMAHLSGDEGLVNAFELGLDIHRATAAEVFDLSTEDVTANQRRSAKAINFGLLYGMSAFGLAKQLGINRTDAQHYMNTYFARYPGVQCYMEETRVKARDKGYVETLFGRRLYLPDINASNGMRRQAAERTAINAPMQGTAADIIKIAMIDVYNWIKDESPLLLPKPEAQPLRMIMQVHDELVFEIPEPQVKEISEKLKTIMESAVELSVPLIAEVGIGDNWEQAH
ncbi:MAG: DNA polymerase I [Gammaproteobacteria bacterium]|nr:MAG: DNA polymerase I [Gammaproteobacteria bacterium]